MKFLKMITVGMVLAGFALAGTSADQVATVKNLKNAIIGETTASTKYAAYSKQAKKEGYDRIALLFNAASQSEMIHANNHRAVLQQLGETMEKFTPEYSVKSTAENLKDAIGGESYEVATMYPEFLKTSSAGNVNLATISFNYAYQTEKKHKAMYENALKKLETEKEKDLSSLYMVCSTCGNTYDGEASARCGISMTPRERFVRIEL